MTRARIGLIGLGYWGSKYLRVLREIPYAEIAFVVDVNAERLRELGLSPSVRGYSELQDALDDNPSSKVPNVIVVTPAASHRTVVQECLNRGLNVLVEKPLTLSLTDARFLVGLSQEAGRLLFPGHIYAHNEAAKALGSLVRQGQLGDVHYVSSLRTGLGPIRGDTNVLWDLVPHDLTILDMMDLLNAEKVSAVGSSFLQAGIHDVVFGTLQYASGSIAHVQASWLDPHKVRTTTVVGNRKMAIFDDVETEDRLRIYERGVDVFPTSEYGEFRTQIRSGDVHIPYISTREPLRNMTEAFLETADKTTFSGEETLRALRIVAVLEAMDKSIRSGGTSTKIEATQLQKVEATSVN